MNFETVLDLFFPHKCSICGMIGESICDECIKVCNNILEVVNNELI